MAKQFDPNALLYRWRFREEDDLVRLIGTDPDLADRSKFFRWIDEPDGWIRREPWGQGVLNAEAIDNQFGMVSGWPGAMPLKGKPGRPKKDLGDEDRPVSVSSSVRRVELFQIQRLASDARKSVSEWIAGVLRAELERARSV